MPFDSNPAAELAENQSAGRHDWKWVISGSAAGETPALPSQSDSDGFERSFGTIRKSEDGDASALTHFESHLANALGEETLKRVARAV